MRMQRLARGGATCIAIWYCLLWLMSVGSAQTPAAPSNPVVVTTYDGPLNRTTVTTAPVTIKCATRSVLCKATYTYAGKVPKRPENVAFEMWTTNSERAWLYFDGALRWKAEKGSAQGPANLSASMKIGEDIREMTDTIKCELPGLLFQALFQSPQVTIGVYGDTNDNGKKLHEDYKLGPTELAPFRTLLSTIPGGSLTAKEASETITIPFKTVFSYMIVQAELNGQGPFNFLVDTGAPSGVSRQLATKLNWKLEGGETGNTPNGTFELALASNVILQVGDLRGNFDKMGVIPLDSISPHLGLRVDGILGNDLLRQMTLDIDYDHNTLWLRNPKTYRSEPDKNTTILPMSLSTGDIINVDITLKQGGKSFVGSFGIDSGSNGSINVFDTLLKRTGLRQLIPHTARVLHGHSGTDLSGASSDEVGRIEQAQLGSFTLNAPQVELSSDSTTAGRVHCDGLIGARVLRRFRTVLDFERKRLILTKGQRFATPDTAIAAGVLLVAEGEDFYPFRIAGVLADSPAADAGLRDGDLVIAIDDAPTKGMTLEEVQTKLDRENHESLVTIHRDETTFKVKLLPRKLF